MTDGWGTRWDEAKMVDVWSTIPSSSIFPDTC